MSQITIVFNFYIYIYLDPRKPGQYEYNDYCFLYEPFYVGKGKGNRLKDKNKSRSTIFKNKIKKLYKLELNPIILKLKDNLNEKESFKLEKELIYEIGRKDLNKGPLINFTDGGFGGSGLIISDKLKKDRSEKYRKNFLEVKNEFINRNCILLSNKNHYINCHSKLQYICPNGHETYTTWSDFKQGHNCYICYYKNIRKGKSNNHKLREKDVINIWEFINKGKLLKFIAEIYNVSSATISDIKRKRTWKYIGEKYENNI